MKLPKLIEVTRDGIRIDGVDFPYAISRDGGNVRVARDKCPSVVVELMADEVRVVDSLADEST